VSVFLTIVVGIPDFRSPGGMYDTLRPELLTATEMQRKEMGLNPTAVVDWSLFRENQLPYLELRRPFILGIHQGKWKPTLGHYFLKVLEERGLLQRVYSQNIDGLEYKAGVEKIVSCHGSLGCASCEFCSNRVDMDWFIEQVESNIKNIYDPSDGPRESSHIYCPVCGRPGVKPSTVLYGRQLPSDFYDSMSLDFPSRVDLLFIIGTSLSVGPANQIPCRVSPACRRVVVNMEPVGEELGLDFSAPRDTFLGGSCDETLRALLSRLGWLQSIR